MQRTYDHDDLIEKLAEGIASLASSAEWERYLALQGRFHRYSYRNALLIAAQRSDATQVAGFRAWRRLGRAVRRGERAIWVLAPMRRRPGPSDDDPGETVRGFKFVAVFDVSQTEGEPLPEIVQSLLGDGPIGAYDGLVGVAEHFGFGVEDHYFSGGTNGDCSHRKRLIRVARDRAPAQRVKTLTHEIAHGLLHEDVTDRALAELEAESVAYVVCQRLGLDTSDYSFGYIAAWSGGAAGAREIRAACRRIQSTAAAILDSIDAPAADIADADS